MIRSHDHDRREIARGIQQPLRSLSGAKAFRVIDPAASWIAEHTHDWPVLSIYVMGDVNKLQQSGDVRVNRPAVTLHGPGEAHAARVGCDGLEQIDVEFDPDWLPEGSRLARDRTVTVWNGGRVAAAGRKLGELWQAAGTSEAELRKATAQLLRTASVEKDKQVPQWLGTAVERAHSLDDLSTTGLARELGLHPGWFAQAYRALVGEGVRETAQRARVEHAARLLRYSNLPLADIAADAGFCDQSHMNRCFRRLLARTPAMIRSEGAQLRPAAERLANA
ncbi:MAG TPA: AraC family transcriptional regulator [Sphingomicrobium sp.]|jgi:AraC-like DNA-binding protein